jgi:hypothetical protein
LGERGASRNLGPHSALILPTTASWLRPQRARRLNLMYWLETACKVQVDALHGAGLTLPSPELAAECRALRRTARSISLMGGRLCCASSIAEPFGLDLTAFAPSPEPRHIQTRHANAFKSIALAVACAAPSRPAKAGRNSVKPVKIAFRTRGPKRWRAVP